MSPADSDISLEFDRRDTDTERDIDFSMALWEVRKPLGRREWKDRPELYDQVWSLLGLDRFGDFWEAVRRFNPSKEKLVELRRVVRSESSELLSLVPHQYMCLCEPFGDVYHQEAASNRKRLEETREDFELLTNEHTIPSTPPLVFSDFAHLEAFRNLYTPWIGAFLFSLSARALFGRDASTEPWRISSEFKAGKLTGNPEDDSRNYWDERYFSQCTWFCLLDTRAHRNEDPVFEQVCNRMERLWTLRPYAQRAGFTMNPGVARTDAEPNLPADVISAIVELGSPALDADRNRQDAIYDYLLEVRRSFPAGSEPRNLLSAVLRFSAPVERVLASLDRIWRKEHCALPGEGQDEDQEPAGDHNLELCRVAADTVFDELIDSPETTSFPRLLWNRAQWRAKDAIDRDEKTRQGIEEEGTDPDTPVPKSMKEAEILNQIRACQFNADQRRRMVGNAEQALHELDHELARRKLLGALHGDRPSDRRILCAEMRIREEGNTPAKQILKEVARQTGLDLKFVRRRRRHMEDRAAANPEITGILKQLGLEPKARRRHRRRKA